MSAPPLWTPSVDPLRRESAGNLSAAVRGTLPAGEDDFALVERMASADADALGELYDRWSSRVYSIAFRIVPDPERAEEITESIFWHAWREAATYDRAHGPVEGWLAGIAWSRAKACRCTRKSDD